MTNDENKKVRVELDHEKKVIRLGCYFYPLKGVLICEATEAEKKKYYCEKYMTYPIVGEGWQVREDECITDGIDLLIIGKEGDTIPLWAAQSALDDNAENHCCSYSDVLVNLESQGVIVSNQLYMDKDQEFSDTIVLDIDFIFGMYYRIDAHWKSYYIPRRFAYVGKDDELYQQTGAMANGFNYTNRKIVDQIADDIESLMWFFHKPNLRVLVTAITNPGFGFTENKCSGIPKTWAPCLQTLETEINERLEQYLKEYPDDYYKGKLPIRKVECPNG